MDSASDLREQLSYYRAIAPEYHEHTIEAPGAAELLAAIETVVCRGDVLELACGTGMWTERLARVASSVTAVDGAPEMLELARRRVDSSSVEFVLADLFEWEPVRQFDLVFFGFWISHVPVERFEPFWSLVSRALAPGGQVFFFDDNYRPVEELVDGPESPYVERQLLDGTMFRIVKVPHEPRTLAERLTDLGWQIEVSGSGAFYWGEGGR